MHAQCGFQVAVVGGHSSGTYFNDVPDNCQGLIKSVKIRSGSRIDAIQLTYKLSNGQDHTGGYHGGTGGRQYTFNVNVDGGERIVGVIGRHDSNYINKLAFYTNKGRFHGFYGSTIGDFFYTDGCLVRGLLGSSSTLLNSIGFQCTSP